MLKTKILTIGVILFALAGVMASSRFTSVAQKQGVGASPDPILEEIAAYRQWKRVNKDTLRVLIPIGNDFARDASGFG